MVLKTKIKKLYTRVTLLVAFINSSTRQTQAACLGLSPFSSPLEFPSSPRKSVGAYRAYADVITNFSRIERFPTSIATKAPRWRKLCYYFCFTRYAATKFGYVPLNTGKISHTRALLIISANTCL